MTQLPGFEIHERLAQKRRTVVYRGLRTRDRVPVILKTSREAYPSAHELARFKLAYELGRRFDHPGLVRILDLIPHGKVLVLVMADFGGRALSRRLHDGPLRLETFLDYAIQIASALEHIHEHGVIHKDVKPDNLVHNAISGRIAIIDFSIASQLASETRSAVGATMLEGSLPYMSPEQTGRMNRPLDYRTDFYSFGVTCYEMLTGRLPFVAQDAMELVHAHLAKVATPVHEVEPRIPRAISEIVSRLMAKAAEERYQSARGVEADLRRCREMLRGDGEVETFELGRSDELSIFRLPTKLYGRDPELQRMHDAFDRVADGGAEMVLVTGYSGVGKSALIEEMHRPITARHGYFVAAKFDQYRRDIPFAGISEAFGDLVDQLLTEPQDQVDRWRRTLLHELDGMGQVVIDVIPEVELLLGPQPSVPELEGPEALNRFADLFERFLGAFTAAEHPLVCFFDDLQWADAATLRLLEKVLGRRDAHHLLILGAFRDYELTPGHPLILWLEAIDDLRPPETIALAPLGESDVRHYLADTLRAPVDEVEDLARLALDKTHGNPFFLGQLLLTLHDDGLLRHDAEARRWIWDESAIRHAEVSEQVLDLMVRKIRALDEEVQTMLRLASCLGNPFDLHTLATVAELPVQLCAERLLEAIQDGLVISLDDSFKYVVAGEVLEDNPRFRFLHDRVHEAAYAPMTDARRIDAHLRIGRLLRRALVPGDLPGFEATTIDGTGSFAPLGDGSSYDTASFAPVAFETGSFGAVVGSEPTGPWRAVGSRPGAPATLEERLFEVVNHLNLADARITDTAERTDLAILNLAAGLKARASTAHLAARDYLRRGLERMPEDGWATHDRVMFGFYRGLTECEYLCGDMERAEELFEEALEHIDDRRDTANLYELMMNAYMTSGRFLDGVQLGRRVLRLFGVELPEDPETFAAVLGEEIAAIRELIGERSLDELAAVPLRDDPDLRTTMSLLHQVWNNSYFAEGMYDHGTIAALRIVRLSLTEGTTDYTSFGWIIYALNLSWMDGDYDGSFEYGQLALRLLHSHHNIHLVAKINNLFAHFISPFRRPIGENVAHYEESYHACLQTGDLWYGLWAVDFIVHVRLIQGVPLEEMRREALKYLDYAESSGNEMMLALLKTDIRLAQALQGEIEAGEDDPLSLDGDGYSEAATVELMRSIPFDFGLYWFSLDKAFLAFLCGDLEAARRHSDLAETHKNTAPGILLLPEHRFLRALILASSLDPLPEAATPDESSAHDTDRHETGRHDADRREIEAIRDELAVWAEHGPANYRHKQLLVDAELLRLAGHGRRALTLYEQAADEAVQSGALHHAGIANERAGALLLRAEHSRGAQGYLTEAAYLYERWGARRKTRQMHGEHSIVLAPATADDLTATSSSTGGLLDLQAVLRASQTLSSQIRSSELLREILDLLMQNAGAERGALLLERDGRWVVAAQGDIHREIEIVEGDRDESAADRLAQAVVHYVLRTGDEVVVDDAARHHLFASDPHIRRHRVRSLLCFRILSPSRQVALLYLENNLTRGAFTDDRLRVLKMLSTQAAISLENALLYGDLEDYTQRLEEKVAERTRELETKNAQLEAKNQEILHTQRQLIDQEKLASLGSLAAGVAHEIKNPLNFVRNFATLSVSLAQLLASELEAADLGESHQLAEDLRSNVEKIQQHSSRIDSVVSSMLSLSRSTSASPEAVDFNDLVEESMKLAFHGMRGSDGRIANVHLETHFEPAIGTVEVVPSNLGRVVLNLCSNALHAVIAKTRGPDDEGPRVEVSTRDLGSEVELRVRDNGTGVAPEIRDRVFLPFVTTKPAGQGTGLGLAICRHIVSEQHRGTITLDSRQGAFTEVVVRLPRRGSSESTAEKRAEGTAESATETEAPARSESRPFGAEAVS